MKRALLLITLTAAVAIGCNRHNSATATAPTNSTAAANLNEADKKAEALLKETYAFLDQKKAPEAEAKLLEIIKLKPQLSDGVRTQVQPAIIGLGMVEPKLGVKLGKMWGDD
jgi:hypothetical protein